MDESFLAEYAQAVSFPDLTITGEYVSKVQKIHQCVFLYLKKKHSSRYRFLNVERVTLNVLLTTDTLA